MVNTCCVPKCTSGYKSSKDKEKISLFCFPSSDAMKKKWMKATPRKNWTLTENHRVCAKHFVKTDIISVSQDTRKDHQAVRKANHLKRLRLKPNAVSCMFPALPRYLPAHRLTERSASATSTARLKRQRYEIEELNKKLSSHDNFTHFDTLKEKLKNKVLPAGYVTVCEKVTISFHYIKKNEDNLKGPELRVFVIVTKNLTFASYIPSTTVPFIVIEHLLTT